MQNGFGWVLLAVALYGLVHSLAASRTVKQWVQNRFGAQVMRFYRLGFSLMAGLTLLPVLYLAWRLPDQTLYTIPLPWAALTLLLQALGGLALLAGVLQTGAMRFIGMDTALDPSAAQQPPRLVANGLYRYVRHPLYTGSLLALWFMPVMTWNLLALNLGITAYFIIGSRFEEDKLLDEFGPAYAEYRRRTPAFLPRLRPPR